MIEYNLTQQVANKLAGVCPFCMSDKDKDNIHATDCPKLILMSRMDDWGEWKGTWPSWGDDMVRHELRGYINTIKE